MDWKEVTNHLQAPLSPDAIKPPPQGKYGEYVEALHVIREANRIFGHDGWSYGVQNISLTNATQDNGKHRVGYMAIVVLDVDGVVRTDVGHGQGFGKSEGDAHDSAVKEAVTDALKRSLRTFGNTFGLALYEKDKSAREVGYAVTDKEIETAINHINNCSTIEELTAYGKSLKRNQPHIAKNEEVKQAGAYRRSELEEK